MSKVKACIFDLDGTILNTIGAIKRSCDLALADYGLGPLDVEHYKVFVGDGASALVERAMHHFGDDDPAHQESCIKVYLEYFAAHCNDGVEHYPGMPEVLKILKSKELKLAVLTNKPTGRAKDNVISFFGKDLFDVIQGDEPGLKRKPDPEGAWNVMKRLQVNPDEVLYFGDTNVDMQTGIAAGMTTAGVLWGFRTREELEAYSPAYILKEPSEILRIASERNP